MEKKKHIFATQKQISYIKYLYYQIGDFKNSRKTHKRLSFHAATKIIPRLEKKCEKVQKLKLRTDTTQYGKVC